MPAAWRPLPQAACRLLIASPQAAADCASCPAVNIAGIALAMPAALRPLPLATCGLQQAKPPGNS